MVSYLGRFFHRFRSRLEQPPYGQPEKKTEGPELVIEINTVYTTPFVQLYLTDRSRLSWFAITVDGQMDVNYFPDIGPGEHEVYAEAVDMGGREFTKKEKIKV